MLPHWVRGPTKRNVFNWAYKGRIDENIKGYGFPEGLGSLHPPVFPPHLLSLALSNSQSNIPSLPLLATLIDNQPEARVAMQIAPMDSRSHFPPSQAPLWEHTTLTIPLPYLFDEVILTGGRGVCSAVDGSSQVDQHQARDSCFHEAAQCSGRRCQE